MTDTDPFLVVGLDGATLDIAEPMMRAGELPTLAGLAERGTYGELRSCVPDSTIPSWFSICSGANPGEFGVYLHSHLEREGDGLVRKSLDTADVSLPMVWDALAMEGYSAGAFNVPSMYPAVCAEGAFLVSGEPIGGDDWVAPAGRRDHLERVVPGFRDVKPTLDTDPPDLIDTVEERTELITEYAGTVLREGDLDFLMTVYKGTDTLGHYFWAAHDPDHPDHDGGEWTDALRDYYASVDDRLAELIEGAPADANVLVISDHGMGRTEGSIALNQWLVDEGYLALADDGNGGAGLGSTLAGVGITRERLRPLVRRLPFADAVERSLSGRVTDSIPERHPLITNVDVDWDATTAYSSREGQIYATGTDPEAVVDRLAGDLRRLADRHGLDLTLHRREETYSGPFVDRAPHLTVDFGATAIRHRLGYEAIYAPGATSDARMGIHRPEGLYFAAGPAFEDAPRGSASVYDVAPTVLHAMGVPLSEVMEGEPLSGLATTADPERVARDRDFRRREITGEEREAVEGTLEDLGYL